MMIDLNRLMIADVDESIETREACWNVLIEHAGVAAVVVVVGYFD